LALAACCAARRMARSLQYRRLDLRAGIQCHQVFLNRPRSASRAHRRCLLPTVLLRTTAGTMVRGIGSRGGRLGCTPGLAMEASVEGAAVVAPSACRRHPPVDAKDIVDGIARVVVLAAIGIGSRSHHRHLFRLLLLHPRRLSPSLLTGSSSAPSSTTASTRTL
jgi:hypothetical protein